MKSRVMQGCLVSVIALLGLAAFLFWQARTPPQVGEVFAQLPPAAQQQRRADAKQFLAQVHGLEDSAHHKDHRPFKLEVTEQTLNTLLQDNLRTEKFQVHDLRAGLAPGQLTLQGRGNYKGLEAVATLIGDVKAQDGKLVYQLDSLKVGGVPAPTEWKTRTQNMVTQKLNDLLNQTPAHIDRVTVAQEKLIIEGVTD